MKIIIENKSNGKELLSFEVFAEYGYEVFVDENNLKDCNVKEKQIGAVKCERHKGYGGNVLRIQTDLAVSDLLHTRNFVGVGTRGNLLYADCSCK
jgi:hypothetical protein